MKALTLPDKCDQSEVQEACQQLRAEAEKLHKQVREAHGTAPELPEQTQDPLHNFDILGRYVAILSAKLDAPLPTLKAATTAKPLTSQLNATQRCLASIGKRAPAPKPETYSGATLKCLEAKRKRQ